MVCTSRPNAATARRRVPALLAVVALLVTVLGWTALPAGADAKAERDKVRKQRAAVAAQLDVLKAQDADVVKALQAIQAELDGAKAEVASAQQSVAVAQAALATAQAAETALGAKLSQLQTSLRTVAINEYVRRTDTGAPQMGDVTDLSQVARQQTLSDLVTTSAANVADQLKATKEDLVRARQQAESAATTAQQRQDEAKAKLADLAAAQARQSDFADKLEARLESTLAEAAGLAQQDAALSAQVAAQEAALRLRTGSGGRATPRTSATVPLRTVGDITVNASIADQVAALLAAAADDGVSLSGSGFRDPAGQQALRGQNCPDPVNSPSGACRPPTARPGFSMHEQGLAIDFSYNGAFITSHSNAGYLWLAANASRFGLYNLPSEPWHWSTTGD